MASEVTASSAGSIMTRLRSTDYFRSRIRLYQLEVIERQIISAFPNLQRMAAAFEYVPGSAFASIDANVCDKCNAFRTAEAGVSPPRN